MSREDEVRNIHSRRKNILHLMHGYLSDNGFYNTATTLAEEARLKDDVELCDNVDLDSMYLEYASYYQLKFGKYPKFLRKSKQPVKLDLAAKRKKCKSQVINTIASERTSINNRFAGKSNCDGSGDGLGPREASNKKQQSNNLNGATDLDGLQVTVLKIDTDVKGESEDVCTVEKTYNHSESLSSLQEVQHSNRSANGELLLSFQEWRNLAEILRSTIVKDDVKLCWTDMCGNGNAVDIIKEAVLTPIKYPHLFEHGVKPWRSVLLHGPPGSGKTMLAKVLYAESKGIVTFFNVTSSMVISKWRGESEKLIKILFFLAQKHAPSIIFLDEIEGLTSKRDRVTDHESSKRFKNELLQLMDGLEQSSTGVFILASTNLPWEMDEAFLRRFEKKLLVQLPNELERALLIDKLLPANVKISEQQMCNLVKLSHNFTGDEIRLACKEIAMQSIRRITKVAAKGEPVENASMELAFKQIRPMSALLMEKHIKWQLEHGS